MALTEEDIAELFNDWSQDLVNATKTLKNLECSLVKYPKYPRLSDTQRTSLWNQVYILADTLRELIHRQPCQKEQATSAEC